MRPLTPQQRRRLAELLKRLRKEWGELSPQQKRRVVQTVRSGALGAAEILRRRRSRRGRR